MVVTSATPVIYGQAVWDSVQLLSRFGSPVSHVVGLVGLGLAALATNLAAPTVGGFRHVPGSLAAVGLVEVMPSRTHLHHPAWSLGLGTSILIYSGLTLRRPSGAASPRGS